MAISGGVSSVSLEDILSKVSEFDILRHYFGISEIPTVINSPLRVDNNPSFGFYTLNGSKIYWTDYKYKTNGGTWDLLTEYWGLDYNAALSRVYKDLPKITTTTCPITTSSNLQTVNSYSKDSDLQCQVRPWKKHDIEFWNSFGITIDWLKYAEIYPISHKIIIKGNNKYVFAADRYAYAYVERKEGKVTLKIYQPFNDKYKWSNKHDRSVISLWTKVPEFGEQIIICSSMKDALCVWANTGIPCIAVQGEGYTVSDTAISELKRRYTNVYILFDNDKAGLLDGEKLSKETGFKNLILPNFGAKDSSDLFKLLEDKSEFKGIILSLLNGDTQENNNYPF